MGTVTRAVESIHHQGRDQPPPRAHHVLSLVMDRQVQLLIADEVEVASHTSHDVVIAHYRQVSGDTTSHLSWRKAHTDPKDRRDYHPVACQQPKLLCDRIRRCHHPPRRTGSLSGLARLPDAAQCPHLS
ncbi:hypothetical protein ACQCSX_22515 (plasmid) [Pseudarthrobacter sp. P1]|uniref:hypothetical protein n=1 Tax=Pseudarthrobacter sp. P1 TaxID=3418418 RepID=UPI003CF49EB6